MLAHSFLIVSSSKLLITRTGIKARTSSILGLWFPWPIYMFFEMRFDLGTLDSGERSLPFGLLVLLSHLRNYLTDSNETCLLCPPQCLVVQVQKKIRSVDKSDRLVPGSDLVEWIFLLYNWESGFKLDSHLLENEKGYEKGCLTFPDFSCLTLGQNKCWFNRDTHLRVRLIPSLLKNNQMSPQHFSFHNILLCLGVTYLLHPWKIRTNFSQVWQIRSNFSHLWQNRLTFTFESVTRVKNSQVFVTNVKNSNEFFTGVQIRANSSHV